ncbi:gliding motility-associated C-terminal domain-containing protein [Larkinella bovis]|uniref:Gliding motility-associated C-terminal domain-containing protein n=2 Tax=Larkinella bovis TaxID=683041 RepID=A0ABW0IEZ1_9BACT
MLLTGLAFAGFSQTCNGVLGEAIINETFGTSVTRPLESGETTYRFVSDRCPGDGEYILANSSHCFGSTWHTITEDHTENDVGGAMLIVNASHEAGEFYSHTVTGLCRGITYEFSVWVLNLMNPVLANGCNPIEPAPLDPNITMKIERPDGSVIQTINTGSIGRSATPTWLRYAVLFTMPDTGNSVVIKLVNNGPGGCGNDLSLDDIQFRPCHPVLAIRYTETASSTLEGCANSKHLIQSDLGSGYERPVYQWQESTDGVKWSNIIHATTDSYLVQVHESENRYYRLVCAPYPNAITEQDTPCQSVSNPLMVTIRNPNDCRGPQIHIPDSFTPNNDGFNDVLNVYHFDNIIFELRIFNRWGSVIFRTDTNGFRWDGTYLEKPCPEGIYPWKVTYRSTDTNQTENDYFKTGQVLLVR